MVKYKVTSLRKLENYLYHRVILALKGYPGDQLDTPIRTSSSMYGEGNLTLCVGKDSRHGGRNYQQTRNELRANRWVVAAGPDFWHLVARIEPKTHRVTVFNPEPENPSIRIIISTLEKMFYESAPFSKVTRLERNVNRLHQVTW